LSRLWRLFEPPVLSEAAKRPSGERRDASISDVEKQSEFFDIRLLEGKSRGVRKAGSAWMGARRALQSPFYTRRQVAGVKKNKKRGTQKF